METKMVISEHHRGMKVPLYKVLADLASQENCDDFEYDMMQEASEYILFLENKITNMELIIKNRR